MTCFIEVKQVVGFTSLICLKSNSVLKYEHDALVTCSLSRLRQQPTQLQDALLFNTNRLLIAVLDVPLHYNTSQCYDDVILTVLTRTTTTYKDKKYSGVQSCFCLLRLMFNEITSRFDWGGWQAAKWLTKLRNIRRVKLFNTKKWLLHSFPIVEIFKNSLTLTQAKSYDN